MSDDRDSNGASAPADEPKQEPGNTVPIVPPDDTANMTAIRAAHRRRASAAMFDSTVFPRPLPLTQAAAGMADGLGTATAVGSAVVMAAGTASGSSAAMASGAATLILMPDWVGLRAELNARLDAIEAGLRAVAPVIQSFETAYREHARIGHNNPPEDIDILPIGLAELELGIVAANLARTEVNAEHPRSDVLRFCGLVLRWTGGLLAASIKWMGSKGEVFLDSYLTALGKAAGPVTAVELAAKLSGINIDLADVVSKIEHIMKLVNLPF
jgi:hypothetical protein